MSRLRANEVLDKSGFGPFLASEGMNLPVGKSVTSVSGVTTFDHDTLTTQNINVNRIDISDTVAGQVILPTARVGFQDGASAYFGDGDDLRIYHNGTNSIIDASPVEIHHSGSKKFETTSTGIDVTGLNVSGTSTFQSNVNLGDNDRLRLGDGNDLQIYHDGSNSFIDDTGTGDLVISATHLRLRSAIAETYLLATANSSVELYYDNSKKIETTNTGVAITGVTTSTDGWAGTTSSADVLGGIVMPFTCGVNGRIGLPPINATMVFGGSEYTGGGDNPEGATMPHDGKLYAVTLHAEQAVGNLTLSATVNGTQNTSYQIAFVSPTVSNPSPIETFYVTPLSFSAGDRLNFGVTTTTLSQLQVLTLTFFVKFD